MAKSRTFSVVLVLSLLVALVAMGRNARAQEVTASIVGTVSDPSGAPINGAEVIATDSERGTTWSAKTNEAGAYNILRLPIGSYSVKISASGFQTGKPPGLHLWF